MSQNQGSEPEFRYTAQMANTIEDKWHKQWDDRGTFNADNPTGDLEGPLAQLTPYFLLDMFPYPSGKGLHVGHPLGYIATDTIARFQRMRGFNVLYTMGFDAFGLPAEQYAIQTGQHPRITTYDNIANMRRQLARLGLSHDKRRSFATTDDLFVRWTQWIFLKIFNAWYDTEATNPAGTKGCARPISELEDEFRSGTRPIATSEGEETFDKAWDDLTAVEQARVLDSYRLAYINEAPVNWAPGLGTVLANEEVTAEGRSERGNFPVFTKRMRQWMMRITAYADRLDADLDTVNWPDKVRSMQHHWIGRSTGARVTFDADGTRLDVFTTRPDTLFGATFMVVAPEHPLLGDEGDAADLNVPAEWPEGTREAWTGGYATPATAVKAYRERAARMTDAERTAEAGEKTGVFSGRFATNPVNGTSIPIFVADYVLMGYGTGAIMAVPAHDQRDFDFARRFDLDIITTITPPEDFDRDEAAWVGDGVITNSANEEVDLNGLGKEAAIERITQWLEERGLGKKTVTYRLRDWLFSRQRYWGEPFPVVYSADGRVHALPDEMLPVTLPEIDDFSPRTFDENDAASEPEAPLGRATDWLDVELDLGEGKQTYRRDTNTMPNWAGSCAYEIRYGDPNNTEHFADPVNEQYWMGPRNPGESGGADLYVGGVEHAVLHLLYARFWQKILFDLGYVSASEPFHRLFNQGYIQAYAYTDSRGVYVPAAEVEEKDGKFFYNGAEVNREYGKMGKSLKNSVAPDDVVEEYGADTLRVYEMSMGPLDTSRPWATKDVVGAHRFLQRLWRLVVDEATGETSVVDTALTDEDSKALHRTIAGVRDDYEHLRDNTVAAKLIEYVNYLTKTYPNGAPRAAVEPLVQMVSPLAPHIAEELWSVLGHSETITFEPFPEFSEQWLVDDTVEVPVQINGKVKARIDVATDASKDDLEAAALADERVAGLIAGKNVVKVIAIPGRMVNLVVK